MEQKCRRKKPTGANCSAAHYTDTSIFTSLEDQEGQPPPNFNTSINKREDLYAKGRVLGFKRAKRNQRPDISLVQIEGVKTAADTEFYLGKRIAFVYRAKREVNGSKIRCIWGRITRAHGGSGAVKARFRNNLPAKSFGASVRVMMYPSRV
ncbi:60S ribosomal protein L33A [Podila clonocystis]|nr:60S ribosomal protein L33A [Podila clonocystis]